MTSTNDRILPLSISSFSLPVQEANRRHIRTIHPGFFHQEQSRHNEGFPVPDSLGQDRTEDLPYGVVKEWRDGFYIALNYTSDIQEIAIPDEAEILIGSARLEPAGVVVWKEQSDDRHK